MIAAQVVQASLYLGTAVGLQSKRRYLITVCVCVSVRVREREKEREYKTICFNKIAIE